MKKQRPTPLLLAGFALCLSSLCLSSLGLLGCVTEPGEGPGINRSNAEAYIRGELPRLVMELDVVEGYAPRDGVEQTLVDILTPLLDKPAGIEIRRDELLPPRGADHTWSFEEIRAEAEARFNSTVPEDAAVFHVMWLDGHYRTPSGGVGLGVAWAGRYVAIFPDSIAEACEGGPLSGDRLCRESEAAVWTHEVGHVLGLVNNGIPMVEDHEDPDHLGHSGDPDAIMYWAFEAPEGSGLLGDRLLGGGTERTFEFSAASVADIAAVRDAP